MEGDLGGEDVLRRFLAEQHQEVDKRVVDLPLLLRLVLAWLGLSQLIRGGAMEQPDGLFDVGRAHFAAGGAFHSVLPGGLRPGRRRGDHGLS